MRLKLILSLIITTCYSFAINKKYDFILRKKTFFLASSSVSEISLEEDCKKFRKKLEFCKSKLFDFLQSKSDWDMKFPVGNETIDCSGPGTRPPFSAAACYKKKKHVNVNQVVFNFRTLNLTKNKDFNDDKLNQWLGDTDIYVHYLFFPPKEYSYDLPYFIRLTGIDTLATVKLNNQVLIII